MFILLSLLALALLQIEPSLQGFAAEFAASFQNKCVHMSPTHFENHQWVSAVVCGKTPAQNSEYRLLQLTGLLHLVVVSGSHLVFLEQILSIFFERFRWSLFAKISVLTAFAMMTGFQPPVVRALCSHLLSHFQMSAKLFWSPPAVTLFAGLVSLMIAPAWWKSISLQLSWAAALSLQIPLAGEKTKVLIKRQLCIFVLMFPLLMQFAAPHPVSIVYNLVAAPFVGVVMFPASAAAMLLPGPLGFVDTLWSTFFRFLEITLPITSAPQAFKVGSLVFSWIYIFGLNLFFILRKQK